MGCIQQDPREREERRREMLRDMEFFRAWMTKILSHAPAPPILLDLKTGEMEQLPLPKEWEDKITECRDAQKAHIKRYFPEFYTSE